MGINNNNNNNRRALVGGALPADHSAGRAEEQQALGRAARAREDVGLAEAF